MPTPRFVVTAAATFVVATSLALQASGPTFWTVATATDFLRGTSDGAYISLNGVLTPGPALTSRLTATPPQVWSLIDAGDGTLIAGTGGDGKVLRLRAGQPEQTLLDAEEPNVFALAASGTRVYAATAPDGKVYAIEADGSSRVFFDPTEKYIWALAVDASGNLWVGAGNPAVIYRVNSTGTSSVIYRPPAAHVVTLARDASGRILAGTESPGRLYRFEAGDRPFVVLDAGMTELRAVSSAGDGTLFAAGVARGDDSTSSGEATSVAITVSSGTPPTGGTSPPASPSKRSVLFRIDPTGSWESIYETGDAIYDVAAQNDGSVIVASGPEGRLYQVSRSREVFLLTGVDAKQITRFATGGRNAGLSAFATANPGRVIGIGTGTQANASYVSPVRDTKSVSTWGLIRWEGTGAVTIHTRSGNTEKPDDSWSDWSAPYAKKDGEPIKSPAARFVQWRAVLANGPAAPSLTAVTVAYLARNTRPAVTSVTAHPPGVVFQKPFSSEEGAIFGLDESTANARRAPGDQGPPAPTPGRRMFQKGLQTIVWKAEDADNDHLVYSLQFRREGETTWRELRTGLNDEIYVWDTTSVADGRYLIRVLASDAPSNSADRTQIGERDSEIVVVDNTAPIISSAIARDGRLRVVVTVRDAQSPIQKLEFSLAGAAWQTVYPADGLADSLEERFEIPLANEADAARLVVRATDVAQNSASGIVR